ncbi:pyridoxal phosphate-dependent aminotransferase [Amaricoccus tamworthensis]|uniref:pyridoxal phosphate-dependent aminotransferase n=1 Tax=Amaricoccus tamworthensis TaxID=57002 RepID=UPI003C7AF0B0
MRVSRRGDVDPFIVMDFMEAARREEAQGKKIIHMEVGQPGTPAPRRAIDTLARQMSSGPLGYTVALGLPELRKRIAGLYQAWYGLSLDPARVVVTSGSSAGFILAFTSLFDAGDRVAIGEPGYPSYRNILHALDLQPVGIQTSVENRFQPVAGELTDDMQGILVASPANPTGTMLDRTALAGLIEASKARGMAFISDEIYHGIQYGKRAVSALEIQDDVYVINSFSKYFSMTGWRIGWMVVPEDHVRRIERIAQNMFICPPHASQVAALAALDATDELEQNVEVYARNRETLLAELPGAGFDRLAPPDGAFYLYADVSDHTDNAEVFARAMLREAGVAVAPGVDFDPHRGHQTIRLSYAGSHADMIEAVKRIGNWLKG